MTHRAAVASLLRDGLLAAGSFTPPDLTPNMEANVTNVAARQVGGMGRSTRKETLHFLAATMRNKTRTYSAERIAA